MKTNETCKLKLLFKKTGVGDGLVSVFDFEDETTKILKTPFPEIPGSRFRKSRKRPFRKSLPFSVRKKNFRKYGPRSLTFAKKYSKIREILQNAAALHPRGYVYSVPSMKKNKFLLP